MANRTRPIRLKFRVTEAEKKKIQKRMAQAKIDNQEAYIRKMAIDGYVVNLEIPGFKEFVSDVRGNSKRFNEIAKRVNATDRIYPEDIAEMRMMLQDIMDKQNGVLAELDKFK